MSEGPVEDSKFKYTYKLTYTYCVQSAEPIPPELLVERRGFLTQDDAIASELMHIVDSDDVNVYLANVRANPKVDTAWSLF